MKGDGLASSGITEIQLKDKVGHSHIHIPFIIMILYVHGLEVSFHVRYGIIGIPPSALARCQYLSQKCTDHKKRDSGSRRGVASTPHDDLEVVAASGDYQQVDTPKPGRTGYLGKNQVDGQQLDRR